MNKLFVHLSVALGKDNTSVYYAVLEGGIVCNFDTESKKWVNVMQLPDKKFFSVEVKIDNNNTEASYQIASLYYNRKEFRNALKYLEKIIKLYPNNHRIVLLMAWSQLQLSRFGDAKLNFEKVLILNPSDESAQEGLSIIP